MPDQNRQSGNPAGPSRLPRGGGNGGSICVEGLSGRQAMALVRAAMDKSMAGKIKQLRISVEQNSPRALDANAGSRSRKGESPDFVSREVADIRAELRRRRRRT
jgi:hypothetical protein